METVLVTLLMLCFKVQDFQMVSDHSGILDGITRLAADVGFPKYLMIDQDSAVFKGLRDAQVDQIYAENGFMCITCPVGGHNVHGNVQRVIKSVQELLDAESIKRPNLPRNKVLIFQTFLTLVGYMDHILLQLRQKE